MTVETLDMRLLIFKLRQCKLEMFDVGLRSPFLQFLCLPCSVKRAAPNSWTRSIVQIFILGPISDVLQTNSNCLFGKQLLSTELVLIACELTQLKCGLDIKVGDPDRVSYAESEFRLKFQILTNRHLKGPNLQIGISIVIN